MDKTFIEWIQEQPDYGLCNPPINSETAFDFIAQYLLEDYYDVCPESADQTRSNMVYCLLRRHSKKFRKEIKNLEKERNKNVRIL